MSTNTRISFSLCLAALLGVLLLSACQQTAFSGGADGAVVLDIGHSTDAEGAKSPGPVNGKILQEAAFWYQYAPVVQRVVERAGYRCVISNRGYAPSREPYRSMARRARVLHLRHPDKRGQRYPSRYFPDRVASGIVSADFAIYRHSKAVVFLHHNSAGRGWRGQGSGSNSIILSNRYNGRPLAQSICDALNREILNHGMPNGGKTAQVAVRYRDADRGAGWLNACDDAGIPAAITEAAFLNNRDHAAFLATEAGARRYAEAIGHGIVAYLRSYAGKPKHRRADTNRPDEGSFGYAPESRRQNIRGAKRLIP